jgi:hypothetical protein
MSRRDRRGIALVVPVLTTVFGCHTIAGFEDFEEDVTAGQVGGIAQFSGLWSQTHGSFDGTCLGRHVETDAEFVFRFRTAPSDDLGLVQLDQKNLTHELWTSPFAVEGNVATATDKSPHVVEPGETDPLLLETAPNTIAITFVLHQFTASGRGLHERIEAVRETGGRSCTYEGNADHERIASLPNRP